MSELPENLIQINAPDDLETRIETPLYQLPIDELEQVKNKIRIEKKEEEKEEIPVYTQPIKKTNPCLMLRKVFGALDTLGALLPRPDNLGAYATHITSMRKHEISQSLTEAAENNPDKKELYTKLSDLVETGGDYAPVIYIVYSKAPELFKPLEGELKAMQALGFNHTLTPEEINNLTNRMIGMDLVKKYGPFSNLKQSDEAILSMSYQDESFFNPIGYEARQEIMEKLPKNIPIKSTGYDPKLAPETPKALSLN